MSRINLETLDEMNTEDIFDWLEGIPDDQAKYPDVGEDSDADNESNIVTPYTGSATRFSHTNTSSSSPSKNTPKLVVDIHNTPSILSSRQRRNHDKKVTYIGQNNEDGTDFDSDDSVNDPNYEDEAPKERCKQK
ncbi:hypothetical protein JTB14_025962 [Gonioctena quinquepunctata]|nr:hypothetical protein JTB14_025962 [Gonioctena quinquepunctata]